MDGGVGSNAGRVGRRFFREGRTLAAGDAGDRASAGSAGSGGGAAEYIQQPEAGRFRGRGGAEETGSGGGRDWGRDRAGGTERGCAVVIRAATAVVHRPVGAREHGVQRTGRSATEGATASGGVAGSVGRSGEATRGGADGLRDRGRERGAEREAREGSAERRKGHEMTRRGDS